MKPATEAFRKALGEASDAEAKFVSDAAAHYSHHCSLDQLQVALRLVQRVHRYVQDLERKSGTGN